MNFTHKPQQKTPLPKNQIVIEKHSQRKKYHAVFGHSHTKYYSCFYFVLSGIGIFKDLLKRKFKKHLEYILF